MMMVVMNRNNRSLSLSTFAADIIDGSREDDDGGDESKRWISDGGDESKRRISLSLLLLRI